MPVGTSSDNGLQFLSSRVLRYYSVFLNDIVVTAQACIPTASTDCSKQNHISKRYTRRICIDSFDSGGVQYDSSSSLCFCKVYMVWSHHDVRCLQDRVPGRF